MYFKQGCACTFCVGSNRIFCLSVPKAYNKTHQWSNIPNSNFLSHMQLCKSSHNKEFIHFKIHKWPQRVPAFSSQGQNKNKMIIILLSCMTLLTPISYIQLIPFMKYQNLLSFFFIFFFKQKLIVTFSSTKQFSD